jgi:hypothetical protein
MEAWNNEFSYPLHNFVAASSWVTGVLCGSCGSRRHAGRADAVDGLRRERSSYPVGWLLQRHGRRGKRRQRSAPARSSLSASCLARCPRARCRRRTTASRVQGSTPGEGCLLGAVWFRGYHLGDGDIHNHLVRDNHFYCLVVE